MPINLDDCVAVWALEESPWNANNFLFTNIHKSYFKLVLIYRKTYLQVDFLRSGGSVGGFREGDSGGEARGRRVICTTIGTWICGSFGESLITYK